MKRRKVAAMLACTMLASGLLAGCGADESSSTAEGETAESTSEDGETSEGSASFTVLVDDNSSTGEYRMVEAINEQTGITMTTEQYPNELATEKLSLALSAGSYPDCIGGWLIQDTDILKYGMNQQLFVPLEDYIEEYAPNIQKVLEMDGVREAMTAPDGHIYSIPYVVEAPLVDYQIIVNTEWLKNVGMEMPTTTEEFEAVLKAFKEQDANGNGDPNDEIPLGFDPDNMNITYMMGWFGASCDEFGMTMDDGELKFVANTDEFKEGVKYLNGLYSQGLIDNEAFTQDKSQWKAKGGKDLYGAVMTYASSDYMPYNAGETPNWEPLPVLSSPNCDDPKWYQDSEGVSILRTQLVVTNNAKDIPSIMKWWNAVYEEENSIQIANGVLGKTLFKEDGGYRKIDVGTLPEDEQDYYAWANLFPQALPRNIPVGFKPLQDPPMFDEKAVVNERYKDHLTGKVPAYWVPLEQADEMGEIQNALKEYMEQCVAKWIAGQADVDEEWDGYCDYLETLGLQDYIDMRLETAAEAQSAE